LFKVEKERGGIRWGKCCDLIADMPNVVVVVEKAKRYWRAPWWLLLIGFRFWFAFV